MDLWTHIIMTSLPSQESMIWSQKQARRAWYDELFQLLVSKASQKIRITARLCHDSRKEHIGGIQFLGGVSCHARSAKSRTAHQGSHSHLCNPVQHSSTSTSMSSISFIKERLENGILRFKYLVRRLRYEMFDPDGTGGSGKLIA
ncbi:hypothetical protein Tco_0399614 [Tanacetum coccineum]